MTGWQAADVVTNVPKSTTAPTSITHIESSRQCHGSISPSSLLSLPRKSTIEALNPAESVLAEESAGVSVDSTTGRFLNRRQS